MLMKIRKQILSTCILLLGVVLAHGQTTATTSGGEASGSGGTATYTVGQVVYHTHSGTNGSVAEGVQQPYGISVVTGIEETAISLINISAYPNPTTEFLKLKVESEKFENLEFQLYDMQGKLLQSNKLTGNEAEINMSTYTPAIYFVRVVKTNGRLSQSIKEFKIIKN